MLQGVLNAFKLPDLRRKLLITFLILVIYRLGSHVPLPNINREVLQQIAEQNALINLLDMFSGGAMTNFSVMMLGVSPYITASIIFQLLVPLIPALEKMQKERDGREKLERYQYLLTIPLTLLQAYAQVRILQSQYNVISAENFGFTPQALLPTISTLFTMTAGTMFAIWLGELITNDGIGNGLSIIIFGGIVSTTPGRLADLVANQQWVELVTFILVTILTIAVIVYVQEGQRRIPVQYGKRVLGMRGNRLRVAGGQSTFIPLRVNSAGMIPLIMAQSLLMFPGVIASYFVNAQTEWVSKVASTVYSVFGGDSPWYWLSYFVLVVLFTYFYTQTIFEQQNMSETLQKQGGFIPGIRPGKRTSDYLNGVLQRITFVGALFLGMVAILPWFVSLMLSLVPNIEMTQYSSSMLISSSGLLIAVGVVLDTMKQLEAQLLMRHYEGFIK
ncbi:MAG: preprotein translocase subunit SecY [Anaerolineae bacterium]|nr:preprotein translocase subunit SecY [Anaerolineae bacterium]